ncbi:uncharacterized protein KZ484_011040 [Pholidichthys leucotaenia]
MVDRHRKLADVDLKSEMELTREDFPEQHVCENEFSSDQQLWNQEENSGLEQEEPEPPQVKEEQEELCISQEGEQLVVKLEADTLMVTLISEENQQSEAEPNSGQLLSHNSGSTKEEPKSKKRLLKTGSHHEDGPQLCDCKEEEVLTVQQLCNQERNSSLDQVEQDLTQVKEEEEHFTNGEEKYFGLKQETDTFMVTPTDEDNDNNETKPNSEQLLSHNSPDTESQDQGADFPEQHVYENKFSSDQQLWNQEENSGLEQEEPEPPQVKEEQEDLCISQEGEQLVVKLETDTFTVTLISEENQQSEAEPNSGQLLSHNSGSMKEELKSRKRRLKTGSHHEDGPQLHDCKEEEVLTVQQLCNQKRNSSLDQVEQDPTQVKEEEELCTSEEEKYFELKQETDTFMVTPTDEDNNNNETEPDSEQLLSHNSPDTESQDQGAGSRSGLGV